MTFIVVAIAFGVVCVVTDPVRRERARLRRQRRRQVAATVADERRHRRLNAGNPS